ncbi:MAG: glycoside hydrolase family 3 C-terminal domain-containing protein [Alistipes sp.]|nr:glycoside hydrolase family 3 C-terminal domain-containing protein [Alistipes sp.]
MKKILLCCFATILAVSVSAEELKLTEKNIDKVIEALTLQEKAHLVVGARLADNKDAGGEIGYTKKLVPGVAGTTYPIERLGIAPVVMADGPSAVRLSVKREGEDKRYYATNVPSEILLASSWNNDATFRIGAILGEETRDYGIDVLLGPGLNMMRNPLCGRNYEYFSEDPLLAGKMGAAMTNGIESMGVGACPKHFAVNNQELNRLHNDARVSQRALREIYLKNFEITVKESQPWTIMTSYNNINGRHASEDRGLLETILRDEWGFKGLVVTDWGGGYDAAKQIWAGNDLIEPGRYAEVKRIMEAVKSGELAEADLDRCVKRVLELVVKSIRHKDYKFSNNPPLEKNGKLTREIEPEGFVLLKNEQSVLPLKQEQKVALFGIGSYNLILANSVSVRSLNGRTVNLNEGLKNAGVVLHDALDKRYTKHLQNEIKRLTPVWKLRRWCSYDIRPVELKDIRNHTASAAEAADIAVITIGRNSSEAFDRHVERDFNLNMHEQAMIAAVSRDFHSRGKKVVVVLNICSPIEIASWRDKVDAILVTWLPGQEAGNSIADALLGKVSPSGHLPITFPMKYADVPSQNFPHNEFEWCSESGKNLSRTFDQKQPLYYDIPNIDYTNYEEDIYIGYRYYATRKVEVAYPFGYGLTYSQFEMSNMKVKESKEGYKVTCEVKNIGKVAAKQVVQLYSSELQPEVDRPIIELRGFQKTPLLQAGESATVEIVIKKTDLMTYNEKASAWKLTKGDYELLLGFDSQTLPLKHKVTISKEILQPVSTNMKPEGELFIK